MHATFSSKAWVMLASSLIASMSLLAFAPVAKAGSGNSSINSVFSDISGCQVSSTEVNVWGEATGSTPPGQITQYHVQIDWGDGSEDNETEDSAFGAEDPSTRSFSGSHVYTTSGLFTITAKIYHQNPNGSDGDADDTASLQVCIVEPLTITKTANTSFTRVWNWTIDKTADQSALLLSDGQLFNVNYGVTVGATSQDSAWNVSGNISITNPASNPAVSVQSVTDTLSADGAIAVVCPDALPHSVAPGATYVCTYTTSVPDGDSQTNTAHVNTDIDVLDADSNTVNVTFGSPTTVTDECADVTDSDVGALGTLCAGVDTLPHVYNYTRSFGKNGAANVLLVCGANSHDNTASFTTNDTSATDDDAVTVTADVACTPGCTLTQGYWKTHNATFKGGAPVDDTWDLLGANKEGTTFALSTKSWFNVFWTPPAGNVYYNLAHQYMAAKLNNLNGANFPAPVQTAFNSATILLDNNTPAQAAALKGNAKNTWTNLAGILANFNEGKAGVPHCSEQ